ncbi:MAG: hypothetical protein ABIH39_03170 [Candidatus Margulisiibacteriota bacterium]
MGIVSGVVYIENLNLRSWLLAVFLLVFRINHGLKKNNTICYYFDSSVAGLWLSKYTAGIFKARIEKLVFKIEDIKDENGLSARLKVHYHEMAKVQTAITIDSDYKELINKIELTGNISLFLEKSIASFELSGPGRITHIWNALMIMHVCLWQTQKSGLSNILPVLIIARRPWFKTLKEYALTNNINLVTYGLRYSIIDLKKALRDFIKRNLYFIYRLLTKMLEMKNMAGDNMLKRTGPAIAVEYYGHLNLDHPERYSDLFYWQQSELGGKDIVLFSNMGLFSKEQYDEIAQHGIEPLYLSFIKKNINRSLRYAFYPDNNNNLSLVKKDLITGYENKWFQETVSEYEILKNYWAELFERKNIKIFTHWYKYDNKSIAITDAMQSTGGITAIYQRAFETHTTPETTIAADIEFGFSKLTAEIEKENKSRIPYHVTTGYPGDFRFPLLKSMAKEVRAQLMKNGAEYIVAFLDENTLDDPRWFTGHEFARNNYSFILNKLLQDPKMGLVIKPKSPRTLRKRLGNAAELLTKAEETGRCYIFEKGHLQGSYPPAVAALASDIAIHEVLCAGTAGLESALTGVPTVLLDQEGWPDSPLYKLGVGKVVFQDWDSLWEQYLNHRRQKAGIPGFGDWSPMLHEFDPFQDGRAAERIGTYLKWLLDGFKAGLPRETVLADAAERYCKIWGKDKITEVNI